MLKVSLIPRCLLVLLQEACVWGGYQDSGHILKLGLEMGFTELGPHWSADMRVNMGNFQQLIVFIPSPHQTCILRNCIVEFEIHTFSS